MAPRPALSAAVLLTILAAGCGGFGDVNITRSNGDVTVIVGGAAPVEGSGKTATEERKIEGFRRISARNAIEVVAEVTGSESATVEADDNLLPLVQTTIENGTLKIGINGSLKTKNPLRVRVTAKQLEGLMADSSATVTGKDLTGDKLELSASSSGHISAQNVQGSELRVAVSSAGAVTADGNVERQKVEASSSGRYDGRKLVSRSARVDCSSAASTSLNASEEVSGSVSSAGSVRYVGNPGKVAVSTSSAGSVQAAGN